MRQINLLQRRGRHIPAGAAPAVRCIPEFLGGCRFHRGWGGGAGCTFQPASGGNSPAFFIYYRENSVHLCVSSVHLCGIASKTFLLKNHIPNHLGRTIKKSVKKGCKKFGKGKKVATFAPALSKCSVTDWYRRKRPKGPDKNFKEKRFAQVVKRYYLCPPGVERLQQKSQNL